MNHPVFDALAARIALPAEAAEIIDAGLRAAGTEWPGVAVDPDVLAAYLADRLGAEALAELPIPDLYIACACAAGDALAIARLEARHFTVIDPALARMQLDSDAIAEIKQQIREKLFVGVPPRILELAGHGDLGALVRITAVRLALNLKRRDRRIELDEEAMLAALSPAADPRAALLTEAQRATVRRAIEDAVALLSDRERGVLRLHLVQRLSVDEIGRVYHVHRATAARWIERVREQLERDTLRLLRERLGLTGAELDSVIRQVISRIEISFHRLLAE